MQKIGKEVKIGLAMIGVLLVAFGVVLVKRLTHSSRGAVADQTAASTHERPAPPRPASEKATVISASDSDRAPDPIGKANHSQWSIGSDRSADPHRMDPLTDTKNPFAPTPRESAAAPDVRPGSMFGRHDGVAPPIRSPTRGTDLPTRAAIRRSMAPGIAPIRRLPEPCKPATRRRLRRPWLLGRRSIRIRSSPNRCPIPRRRETSRGPAESPLPPIARRARSRLVARLRRRAAARSLPAIHGRRDAAGRSVRPPIDRTRRSGPFVGSTFCRSAVVAFEWACGGG